jgi:hypothetical protein
LCILDMAFEISAIQKKVRCLKTRPGKAASAGADNL